MGVGPIRFPRQDSLPDWVWEPSLNLVSGSSAGGRNSSFLAQLWRSCLPRSQAGWGAPSDSASLQGGVWGWGRVTE